MLTLVSFGVRIPDVGDLMTRVLLWTDGCDIFAILGLSTWSVSTSCPRDIRNPKVRNPDSSTILGILQFSILLLRIKPCTTSYRSNDCRWFWAISNGSRSLPLCALSCCSLDVENQRSRSLMARSDDNCAPPGLLRILLDPLAQILEEFWLLRLCRVFTHKVLSLLSFPVTQIS